MVFPSKVSLLQQVDSGIPQTIQRGHRNPPVLRTCCFRSTTVISHLLKLFLIFPDLGGFTLSLYVEHLGEVWLHLQKKPQVQGTLAVGHEQAHSPTILTLFFHFLVLPTELLFLIHSHSLFFFFSLFFLLSYWQRLPLCGKSLYARRFCKIPLPEAHEVCARELVHSGDIFR